MSNRRWGRWTHRGDSLLIDADVDAVGEPYEVDLTLIVTENDVFNTLTHLSEKRWITKEDINAVMQACRTILSERRNRFRSDRECRWETPDAPSPMGHDEFGSVVTNEWQRFLNSADPGDEPSFQKFLEKYPCLLPDPYATYGGGHHGTVHGGVIAQPELPGFRAKVPDFMSVVRDSAAVTPFLIEIEAPSKKWSNVDGTPTGTLSRAIDQVRSWKAWFKEPENVIQFRKVYGIDENLLRGRQLEPRYVLIYGRRSEAMNSQTFGRKRRLLEASDETFMTYDRLAPGKHNRDDLTLRLDRSLADAAFVVTAIPPTFRLDRTSVRVLGGLRGRESAIKNSPWMSEARKTFLLERLPELDEYARRYGDPSDW